jgi:hypothetical protein
LPSLRPCRGIARHPLAFAKGSETIYLDGRVVNEEILAAIIRLNEPESFHIIEPFYCSRWQSLYGFRIEACGTWMKDGLYGQGKEL